MADDLIKFNARMLHTWTPDRLYRVYLTRDELFFIRIGGQGGMNEAAAAQFGLLGVLLSNTVVKRSKRKLEAIIAEVDANPPSLQLSKHKHNFRVLRSEVDQTKLEPPSTFASHGHHFGRWRITFRGKKPITLQFEEFNDMQTALQTLPKFFGSRMTVNVRWDLYAHKFVKGSD
jgi:hypothetical protein